MKNFRTAFPYVTEITVPDDINELLDKYSFDGLSDSDRRGHGWGLIVDERMLSVDGKYLLRYCASQRKANPLAVHKLAGERQQKAIDEGREITPALMEEFLFQAESEVIKYAPVTTVSVFLLIWPSKRLLLASGSTAAKCEEALSMLRKTLGSLSSFPWGLCSTISQVVTDVMTTDNSVYKLPDNLVISPFGKTIFTGEDSSLKIVLDGVQNDTDDAKSMLNGMMARSVEMSLIDRPANGQIKNMANFILHMPPAGNAHLKCFDYDDDVERDDGISSLIAEMHLVSAYVVTILSAVEYFTGMKSTGANVIQEE
ncbi:hypothetical protein BKZ89_21205 [Salmonella enterica subsp. enterica serovar Typhimurium]|uniref:Recombination-associated protein RdgC n=2 Tax=Salmonella enterica TaxID=28901 RepID=A0A7U7L6Z5_SALER|nr:recombination-associated protein RdgC [Salmonella enterica]EDC8733502.1 hypothetical protein [Salmonella enterica subsp. enterica serovar Typhimurium]EDQ0931880.1 hypothetical protein [Salmonella enterica subsp. enterica serovar Anatum]EDR1391505.1 hypothetical protein [Salmonella enterica subsp. enterica serovar Thompson]EDT4292452.1 hypothetical protein [Salmonella enterica subsp. enterica serovar Javiana]EAA8667405.1 hypothetical protein [Salmonella enterica]